MKPNRFAQLAKYRKFVAKVSNAVSAGHVVCILAGWTVMKFKPSNIACIKANSAGVFVQRGKSWVCIMDRAVSPNKVWAE